jgi:anaerobic selenocysteine-containing dehydrogenase
MNVKRRQFLKQTGLAGAMAVAAAGVFRSSEADAATAGGGAARKAPRCPKAWRC